MEEADNLGMSFLLKNAIGWLFWDKTAPIATLDVSVVTSKGAEKFGRAKIGSSTITSFSFCGTLRPTSAGSDCRCKEAWIRSDSW